MYPEVSMNRNKIKNLLLYKMFVVILLLACRPAPYFHCYDNDKYITTCKEITDLYAINVRMYCRYGSILYVYGEVKITNKSQYTVSLNMKNWSAECEPVEYKKKFLGKHYSTFKNITRQIPPNSTFSYYIGLDFGDIEDLSFHNVEDLNRFFRNESIKLKLGKLEFPNKNYELGPYLFKAKPAKDI
jgi:hypothetical protein